MEGRECMKLTGLEQEIFLKKYAMPNEVEWEQCAQRVANYISQAEKNGDAEKWSDIFFQAIKDGHLMPGGRILFGSGRRNYNLLNCYRLHPTDAVSSIGQTIKESYQISCGGGGIGYNFSDIRPKGDDIQTVKNSAPGSVSVMKMINEIGQHVRAGKNRRTALIAILNVTHPDLLDFLHVKLNLNELNNFNISVGITSTFIDAVRKNKEWHFTFNNKRYDFYKARRVSKDQSVNKEEVQITALSEEDAAARLEQHCKVHFEDSFTDIKKCSLKAKDIWTLIINNSWKCGDPGLYNLTLANQFTNVSYFEDLSSPNPCGEINLPPYGNCCLGHINLSEMYDEVTNDVDWKKFAETVHIGIRFLDDVLSVNHYPIPECKEVGEKSRRIGLGVTGLHYLLIKLGYKYGDERCLKFLERLFATFRNEAYMASIEIAKEKGSFPAFDADKFLEEGFASKLPQRIRNAIKKYGIRNAVMLTIAPCGTNSMVLGVSSGLEPIFAPIYERSFRDSNVWKTTLVGDKLFLDYIKNGKNIEHIVGAHDITVQQHIAVQATVQQFIDSSISKTINLPENFDVNNLSDLLLEYAEDLKGITVYRTNSRGLEPLKPIPVSEEILNQLLVAEVAIRDNCVTGVCEI